MKDKKEPVNKDYPADSLAKRHNQQIICDKDTCTYNNCEDNSCTLPCIKISNPKDINDEIVEIEQPICDNFHCCSCNENEEDE
ncbi:MAG: hypothetical protein RR047_01810 [Bacilli bacterium]